MPGCIGQASVASLVPGDELHEAYALSAITWSMMLSLGALAGGLLVDLVGINGVFILDSFTYVASALMLWKLELPRPTPSAATSHGSGDRGAQTVLNTSRTPPMTTP